MTVKQAMVLAAGLGVRMRPLTNDTPKPLLAVGGKAMIDHALDHLAAIGIGDCVVNAHYLADMVATHLESRDLPAIHLVTEPDLLDTGGGVSHVRQLLGPDPFYVVNGDILWRDGPTPALARLAQAWDDGAMDALLLVHPTEDAFGYDGGGDFFLGHGGGGPLRRRIKGEAAPFVFTGIQILHPGLFSDAPEGAFSLNFLYDRALAAGRLHGLVHDGEWFHIGTPETLARAEQHLSAGP
ncbi:MAG: nucleotidyltransferase family protein [Alphaproteobacteria bacterium]